jgi:hypothetical protein
MMTRRDFSASSLFAFAQSPPAAQAIGSRRELFVDREMIGETRGVELRLATAVDAGEAFRFDRPYEGRFSGYATMLRDGDRVRAYYRGSPSPGEDGQPGEVTCFAESRDGITWTKPKNNIVLSGQPPFSHNFCPMIDTRPGVAASERYKAIAGIHKSGLYAFVSADGVKWRKLQAEAVLPSPKEFVFDSQNLAFWSESEQKYLIYFRSWRKVAGTVYRWVSRAVSDDFAQWRVEGQVDYGDAPPEHLYTSQMSAYFRAPHIYTGLSGRFFPNRQVLSADEAKAVGVDPKYYKDCSDAVLVTSRGGLRFHRTFLEAFVRPGLGLENWVSRSNYPALNVIQTGPSTMSFYVNRNYGQPTAYLRRYELRLDGFASANAGYAGGTLTTKPFTYTGSKLELNFATSAAGSVRVELLAPDGRVLTPQSAPMTGDQIDRVYPFGADPRQWQERPVQLRFHLKDADLYSFRFV